MAAISGLSDGDVRGASLLPGWSRAHVLTHLARNAEGGTRLLGWALTGEPSYEYVSLAARAAAIEAGADRAAAALIDDVRQTSRWGEVLIHHVDLAIGYQPAHWPADPPGGHRAPGRARDLLTRAAKPLGSRPTMDRDLTG